MKKSIFIFIAILISIALLFYIINDFAKDKSQTIYEETLQISEKYLSLSYRTDNILTNPLYYKNYDNWNNELDIIIKEWKKLEKEALKLEVKSSDFENRNSKSNKLVFNFNGIVHAYDKTEVTKVFDSAPAGKKIMTLAKHLGVDAKRAYLILTQEQNQSTADEWNKEGDTFANYEKTATRIKNGSKVVGFVSGIALTGGTSALLTSGALANTAVIVSGADLVLEITDDETRIAYGDKNKVSEIVTSLKSVTEPAASILTLVTMPGNLVKKIQKVNAVAFAADQAKGLVQDGKILGINIKSVGKKSIVAITSSLDNEELKSWKKDNNITTYQTIEEVLELNIILEKTTTKEHGNSKQLSGIWVGKRIWTESQKTEEKSENISFEFKNDGTIIETSGIFDFKTWEQFDDIIKIYPNDCLGCYGEFKLNKNELVFSKFTGPSDDDPNVWTDMLAGSNFFGGKFFEMILTKT